MEDQLRKILNIIGNVLVIDAKKNLAAKQKNASYTLTNNIRYVVSETATGLELSIIMPEHGLWVIGGRAKNLPPNKRPPIAPIVKWLKDKNLARKFLGGKEAGAGGNVNPNNPKFEERLRFIAMKISAKIAARGIDPFNFLSPTKVVFIGEKQAYLQLPKEYLKQVIDAYKAQTQEKLTTGVYRQLVGLM